MHLNGRHIEPPLSPEFTQLLAIVDVLRLKGLRPFRTEVCLSHFGLCLCGQADALFVDQDGQLVILDWKRTKSISFDNPFQTLREPINHLPDKNGWLYALQLNTYKYMLESEAGFRVASMYLGQVHPSLARGRLIEVPPMAEEMSLIVEDQIELGHAVCRAVTGADAQFVLPRKERASLRYVHELLHPTAVCAPSLHSRASAGSRWSAQANVC